MGARQCSCPVTEQGLWMRMPWSSSRQLEILPCHPQRTCKQISSQGQLGHRVMLQNRAYKFQTLYVRTHLLRHAVKSLGSTRLSMTRTMSMLTPYHCSNKQTFCW